MAELTDGTAELRVLVTTALGALPLENKSEAKRS